MQKLSDLELLEAWRNGDKEAGACLVDRHFAAVERFFRNKVGDRSNDLVQNTFLACVEAKERFRGEGSFRSFLFGIAYKQLFKHYGKQHREAENIDFGLTSVYDLEPTPSRMVAKQQEQQLVLEALRRIPLDYQVVLELRFWESLKVPEIAEVLAIPLGTAKTRLRRGAELLVQQLRELASPQEVMDKTVNDLDAYGRALGRQIFNI